MQWQIAKDLVHYPQAVLEMEKRVDDIIASREAELIWLLEHPDLYTAGTSAHTDDLLEQNKLPVFQTGRGGQYTYHGPGQRVMYLMLDLKARAYSKQPDLKQYIYNLEQLIINTLASFDIVSERKAGRVGIWVTDTSGQEAKIAAIGIRVRKWVTYHGIAINLNPNLEHFRGIIPCGLKDFGVTSIHKLGKNISMLSLDEELKRQFEVVFANSYPCA